MKFLVVTTAAILSHAFVVNKACAQQSSLSDQCASETKNLAAVEAIMAAVPSADCTIDLDISNNCTTDFGPNSGNFNDACLGAGGRLYTTDLSYNCTTFAFGETFDADYTYLSFPACVGASCTDEELATYYENSVHPLMEETFAVRGLNCEVAEKIAKEAVDDSDKGSDSKSTSDAGSYSANKVLCVVSSLMFATAISAL